MNDIPHLTYIQPCSPDIPKKSDLNTLKISITDRGDSPLSTVQDCISSPNSPNENQPISHGIALENPQAVIQISAPETVSEVVPATSVNSSQRSRSIAELINHHMSTAEGIESKLMIIQVMGLCLFVGTLSTVVLASSSGKIPYRGLSVVLYCYLGYLMIENIIRARRLQRATWKRREDTYGIFDVLSLFIMIIFIDFSNVVSTVVVPLVFVLLAVLYFFYSLAPKSMKICGSIIRFSFAILGYQIIAQQRKLIKEDWSLVFVIAWAYLLMPIASLVVYALYLAVLNPFSCVRFILRTPYTQSVAREKLTVTLWFIGSFGLNLALSGFLLGIAHALNGQQGSNIMKISAILGLLVCVSCILFTMRIYTILIKHAEKFTCVHLFLDVEEEETRVQSGTKSCSAIAFEPKKRIYYFIKLSESYFVPAHKSQLLKNIEKRNYASTQTQEPLNKSEDKDDEKELEDDAKFFLNRRNSLEIISVSDKKSLPSKETKKRCHSVALSSQLNIEPLFSAKKDRPVLTDNDKNCYICCTQAPNAIMTDCGHGGICSKCAMIQVIEKSKCMECRGPVNRIACITQETGLRGVYHCRGCSGIAETEVENQKI